MTTTPSPSWNTVRIYGTWKNVDGSPKPGSYHVTFPVRVVVDGTVIPTTRFSGTLNTSGSGASLDFNCPATDDPDVTPNGWQVTVTVVFNDGSAPETYTLDVPLASAGTGINLADVVLPQTLPATQSLIYRGVPGGLAEYDSDGDLIDAAGNKVTATPPAPYSYAKRSITVDDVIAAGPIVIAHRGVGTNLGPDNTADGFAMGYGWGLGVVECDTVKLADGALALSHDFTADRTTDGTGNIEDMTSAKWRMLNNDPANWGYPGWRTQPVMTWGDVLRQYGGKVTLWPEVKGATAQATAITAADIVTRTARDAGLEKSVVVASFVFDACVAAVQGGCDGFFLASDGSGKTPAQLVAAGVRFMGCDFAVTPDATLQSFIDAGIHVIPYGVLYQKDYDALIAKGCKGVTTEEPLYASRRYSQYRVTKSSWTVNGVHGHGHLSQRGTFIGTEGAYRFKPSSSANALMGELSPVANPGGTYTITGSFTLDTAGSNDTFFHGIYWGVTADGAFTGDPLNGNLCMLRQNGLFRLTARAIGEGFFAVVGVDVQTAPLTSGSTAAVKITTTPTTITIERTDTPVATTSGTLTSGVAVTSIPVAALPYAQASGAKVMLPTGQVATLSGAHAAGATALTVTSITPSSTVASGSALNACNQSNNTKARGGYIYARDSGQNTGGRAGSFGPIIVT